VTNVQLDGPGNFSVGNNQWQLTILDASESVVFGPIGEGIGQLRGINNQEVAKLEESPSTSIDPETAEYNDGSSSTFGAANIWSSGEFVQDLRALRGQALPLEAGDADQDLDFDQTDLVQVQVAAKYLTGQPATWGEGDWNGAPGGSPGNPPTGDGRFDQQDIVAAMQAGNYLQGPYAATQLDAIRQRPAQGPLPIGPDDLRAVDALAGGNVVADGALVPQAVPEPTTGMLLAGGLLGLVTARWPYRRRGRPRQ
jgi:hypothetical protein